MPRAVAAQPRSDGEEARTMTATVTLATTAGRAPDGQGRSTRARSEMSCGRLNSEPGGQS